MVQKRPLGEDESSDFSSKQPRQAEPSYQLVSVLEFPRESFVLKHCASGGDKDNTTGIKPDADQKPNNRNVAEDFSPPEKETEIGVYGSASNSSWPTSSTSEEDTRSEARFHVLTSPEYFYHDHLFRAAAPPRVMYSASMSDPPRKRVPIGPEFQAELPECGSYVDNGTPDPSKSQADNNKLTGTTIIPMPKMEPPADHEENIGVGRVECMCEDKGSIRCVRQHISEAREKLKQAFGDEAFVKLGFCDMGEVVAEKWTEEEEELFHEVVFSNPVSLGRDFWNHLAVEFPSRSKKELVSYYFNVFMLRKRAAQNRFYPLNIDSDDDEWQETDAADDDDRAKITSDEDEDSVVESPIYHHDLGFKGIYDEHDEQVYDEEAGDATWEGYKQANFGSQNVNGVPESRTGRFFDGNSNCKLSMQPLAQGVSNEVVKREVQDSSCTTNAAVDTSKSSLGKTDNDKHWASEYENDNVLEPCIGKEWDARYFSCAKNEFDLLPTHNMIEEVFGDGSWMYKGRDGEGL